MDTGISFLRPGRPEFIILPTPSPLRDYFILSGNKNKRTVSVPLRDKGQVVFLFFCEVSNIFGVRKREKSGDRSLVHRPSLVFSARPWGGAGWAAGTERGPCRMRQQQKGENFRDIVPYILPENGEVSRAMPAKHTFSGKGNLAA